MSTLKKIWAWLKLLWNLREELEEIILLVQKHREYLARDFEAIKTLKAKLDAAEEGEDAP